MGKKRKKTDAKADKEISFDVKSRFDFLTGFRKRKQARRRKAVADIIEKERQDKIQIKKEIRDDVKRKWKQVQFAEKRAERLVDKIIEKRRALPGRAGLALADGMAGSEEDEDDSASASEDAPVVVTFDREDDDPFGDCEVTATAGDGTLQTLNLQSPPNDEDRLVPASRRDGESGGGALAVRKDEDLVAARQRRFESARKEEARRQKVMQTKVTKRIAVAKTLGKKKPKKKQAKNGGRTGAKERRKRQKKHNRK